MLKRVQKEVRELKKKSAKKHKKIIRYQIVSTYFLDGAFKVLFFGLKTCLQPSFVLIVRTLVLPPNTLKTCSHYMLCGYKKKWANLRGLQGGANVNKKQLKRFCLGTWEFARGASQ
jgi:hypothetical protein